MVVESASSVTVSWVPPDVHYWNGVITGYIVFYMNQGPLQGGAGEGSGLSPFTLQMISVPPLGQLLRNSPDPALVSLPLKEESVLIEGLEEYHSYSFAVYQENTVGSSPVSDDITQELPEAGMLLPCIV